MAASGLGGWTGQSNDGRTTHSTAPVRVGLNNDWTAVAAGSRHSAGLKSDGSLWAWGSYFSGESGDGTTNLNRPGRLGADADWAVIAAGEHSGLALKTDGSLWAWTSEAFRPRLPRRIGADTGWAAITMAYYDGLALKTDGSLWHLPEFGAPQQVGTDNDWFTVTEGCATSQDGEDYRHYKALKADGSLFTWGANFWSQLGDGTTEVYRPAPVPIGKDTDWAAITAGWSHCAALKQDGSLWTWGGNWSGQLGNGTILSTNRPVRAGSDNAWLVIAAGSYHTVGLKANGSLWAWGANESGQLGIGTTESTNVPVRIGTDNDWAVPLRGSEFRMTSQAVGGDGRFRVAFNTTNQFSYFILYRGTEVTNVHQPVDATLGPFVFQLSDAPPFLSNGGAFYRIRAVPFAQALDLDGDGIDDGYELRHRTFLNPFNPADASLDFDGDSRTNLQEYREGTDPSTPSDTPWNGSKLE